MRWLPSHRRDTAHQAWRDLPQAVVPSNAERELEFLQREAAGIGPQSMRLPHGVLFGKVGQKRRQTKVLAGFVEKCLDSE